MGVMKTNQVFIVVVIIVAVISIMTTINLPLPEGVPKNSIAESRIESCTIKESSGYKVKTSSFVGIRLEDKKLPYLRWNPKSEYEKVIKLCKEKAKIKVEYKAQRILLRSQVTYWIKSIYVEQN